MRDAIEWPLPYSRSRYTAPPPRVRRRKAVPVPRGYYKPASLRWPFLAAQLALLAAALSILVLLQRSIPDSDHSAVVDGRPLARRAAAVPNSEIYHGLELHNSLYFKRQINNSDAATEAATQLPTPTTASPVTPPPPIATNTSVVITTSKSKRPSRFSPSNPEGKAHNENGPGPILETPEPTTGYADTVNYEEATVTDLVQQPSSNHPKAEPTTITEIVTHGCGG